MQYFFPRVLVSLALIVFVGRVHAVELSEYDVAGVKTGMTWGQVVEALHRTQGLSEMDLQKRVRTEFVNPVSGAREPAHVSLNLDRVRIELKFVPNYFRPDTAHGVVSFVSYTMPYRPEYIDAVVSHAREKFGEPSYSNRDYSHHWCSTAVQNRGCPQSLPYLVVKGARVALLDERYSRAWASRQNGSHVTPRF